MVTLRMQWKGVANCFVVIFLNLSVLHFVESHRFRSSNGKSDKYSLPTLSPETLAIIQSIEVKWHSSGFSWNNDQNSITCDACIFGFTTLQTLLALHLPQDQIVEVMAGVCTDLKARSFLSESNHFICVLRSIYLTTTYRLSQIESKVVCHGIMQEFRNETFYVLEYVSYSPGEICNIVTGKSCVVDPPSFQWTVPLPDVPKPPSQRVLPLEPGSPTLRVLHLSDLHVDLLYQEGSNAQCGNPLCCRNGDGPVGNYFRCTTCFEN